MSTFLADTSIWGWAERGRRPDITARLAARVERDELATCIPVVLEALQKARTADEYERQLRGYFGSLRWVPTGAEVSARAFEVQRSLARGPEGNHRRPAIDYLIAAAAELAGDVVLWFLDRDLEVICEHTGQPYESES